MILCRPCTRSPSAKRRWFEPTLGATACLVGGLIVLGFSPFEVAMAGPKFIRGQSSPLVVLSGADGEIDSIPPGEPASPPVLAFGVWTVGELAGANSEVGKHFFTTRVRRITEPELHWYAVSWSAVYKVATVSSGIFGSPVVPPCCVTQDHAWVDDRSAV